MNLPKHTAAAVSGAMNDWLPGWLDACPAASREVAERLLTDDRMRRLWETKFTPAQLVMTVTEFEVATDRDHWSDKTQRERDTWQAKFEKTADALLELMQEAPTPPESWGFPARDVVLMNVIHRMGFPLPEGDSSEFFPRMLELEAAADAECWTIADALNHYREQQRADCGATQVLRKPGDAKAGRAEFIVRMRKRSLSASEVATIAQVVFEDESIDDRVVRRLTASRTDSRET